MSIRGKNLRWLENAVKANAIAQFGFNTPIVIDDDNLIMAGHGRIAAAKLLEMKKVPCFRIGAMSSAARVAYSLADNKTCPNGGWNKEVLALEFQELLDEEFKVETNGFELADVDQVIFDYTEGLTKPTGPEDQHPEPPDATQAVTRPGDVWEMNNSRLACGDSKDPEVLRDLMPGEEPDMIITDPLITAQTSPGAGERIIGNLPKPQGK